MHELQQTCEIRLADAETHFLLKRQELLVEIEYLKEQSNVRVGNESQQTVTKPQSPTSPVMDVAEIEACLLVELSARKKQQHPLAGCPTTPRMVSFSADSADTPPGPPGDAAPGGDTPRSSARPVAWLAEQVGSGIKVLRAKIETVGEESSPMEAWTSSSSQKGVLERARAAQEVTRLRAQLTEAMHTIHEQDALIHQGKRQIRPYLCLWD